MIIKQKKTHAFIYIVLSVLKYLIYYYHRHHHHHESNKRSFYILFLLTRIYIKKERFRLFQLSLIFSRKMSNSSKEPIPFFFIILIPMKFKMFYNHFNLCQMSVYKKRRRRNYSQMLAVGLLFNRYKIIN